MTSPHRLLALSFVLVLSGYGIANAQGATAGSYKLAVGNANPCALTLAEDGTASVGTECAHVSDVTRWHATPSGLQLQDNSGTTIAVLKEKGDAYAGATFADNHQLVLTRSGGVAVASH